ncbi:MAG: hypothetical protein RMK18_12110 [Armatimonadota bacterium]|nr:hypothetical protein [Armatimonadota bacterium]MDW8026589.1 hypothetical protein [Armatimonadota bacterium]
MGILLSENFWEYAIPLLESPNDKNSHRVASSLVGDGIERPS